MRYVQANVVMPMTPEEVMDAFIVQRHLKAWWQVSRSHIELRPGGVYTLVWQRDSSCLNYVSTGIVKEYLPGCQLVIEKMMYVNPERGIFGPMELSVMVTPEEDHTTTLTVVQSGYQDGTDWDWYYEAVKKAWPAALEQARDYLLSAFAK